MKEGFVQQIGTPRQVFHDPNNLFVAGFIGTPQMNFFEARLCREGDQYHLSSMASGWRSPRRSSGGF